MNEQRDHSYSKLKFLKIFTEKFDEKFRCCLKKKKKTNIERIHRSEHQFSVILFRITITEVEYRARIKRNKRRK